MYKSVRIYQFPSISTVCHIHLMAHGPAWLLSDVAARSLLTSAKSECLLSSLPVDTL